MMSFKVRWKLERKFLYIYILLIWNLSSTYGQGYFPKLEDLAVLKPITSSSTCGATSSKYCQSLAKQTSLTTCVEKNCEFACCTNCGPAKPVPTDLALTSNKVGVTQDGDPRNGTIVRSFRFQGNSYLQPLRVPFINFQNSGFTISVWIKQKAGNKGTIISKDETTPPNFANVFQLVIKDYNLMFYYRPATGNASVATYNLLQSQSEKLQPNEWHLITVAVIDKALSYYIDGELMNANFVTLSDYIGDSGGGIRIGQKYGGDTEWQYEGLMQDIFMYDRALTNREAEEAFTGILPTVYVASNCRCPPTHPKINVAEPAKCLKNLDGDTETLSRLKDTAHPIEFATDGDTLSFWLSEITENATIRVNLAYTGLQVFYIVLTFYGPVPGAIKIERSVDSGHTYEPWQYFAEDCVTSFNLQNNGPLTQPDSVNCVQYIKPLQSSREVLTFQTEYPPPPGSNIPVRPFGSGCSNLYCSDRLLQFLKATHVKFNFYNHTLVQNPLHRYYGLERILVTGRCECFGHASSFSYIEGNDTHIGRCICDCHPSTNTEGETCNRCKPLYNDKPFRRGDHDDSYPCVKCECNDHANSCLYNQTLDTSPASRTQGGGGVCIDCQHNTTGRFCDVCKERFYRESGKSLKSPDVCSLCGCEGPGVEPGELDCVKDDSNSSVVAGQCVCKDNTQGRQCDECKDGFYDLKASHATGCISCDCVLDGTISRNISCHRTSGQCYCKDRVTGRTCNTCKAGYWGLSGHEPLGCKTCDCDPFGTTAGNENTCNSVTGQCSCKAGVIGRKCDQCKDGFHSLTPNGCSSCNCSIAGTPSSLLDQCDKTTGECTCKLNVEGKNCDQCKQGFYNLSQSNPQGCTQCVCDTKGTVGGSGQCEQQSGNCTCKPLVIGQTCNQCKLGTFGLNQSDPNGCQPCNCYPKGTIDGDKKNPDELQCSSNNGQCFCLSSVSGLRCDSCAAEYFWNPTGQGCVQCQCNPTGSVGKNCNDTGQCTCKANIGGRRCDRCVDGFYGFTTTGNCIPCNCNVAGSLTNQCDETGQCTCKVNVEGKQCDKCKNGTINLQQNNKYGCSGAPSEQPAPFVTVLSSRAIMLTWSPPDNPNGIILRYEMYRNDTLAYTGLNQTFNDTGLTPDTVYYYYIITFTESGQTRSLDDGNVYRTFQDAPGGMSAPVITNILPRNATASWQRPSMPNGRITEYRLISTNSRSSVEVVNCRGVIFMCKLGNLKPYTVYNFSVVACTNGGCARSNVTTILTLPTLPDFQPAPNVTSLPGGTAVRVAWDEPSQPNGRILRYELYMRAGGDTSDGVLKFNSNPAHDPTTINFRETNVTGLVPFKVYEFRVRTFTAQVKGDRDSNWTKHRTGEGTPLGENVMNTGANAFNSSAVIVSWSPPQTPQGVIFRYVIYKYQPPSNSTAVMAVEVPGSERQGMVVGLQPYTQYKFTVIACNSFACSGHSPQALARTLAAAPEEQGPPSVLSVDSSTVYLRWPQPQIPNGPLPPSYNLSRAYSALYFPPPVVSEGVHFPGLGFYKFPSNFVQAGARNDIQLWFRTKYASGLLLFLASDGSQTDMLAIQLKDGKPWLIFDSQDGPAAFTINQPVRFDDGEWHLLKVSRVSRRGTLTVDGYQASQNSPGAATVISANTGVYIGGLPSSFTILRADTGNSKIEKISFIGCIRGVTSEQAASVSKQLDWTSALEAVSVEPQRNGCPERDNKRALFLRGGGYVAVDSNIADIFTNNIFSFTLKFRTQLSSGLLLFAHGSTTIFSIQFSDDRVETKYVTTSVRDNVTVQLPSGEICDGEWHNMTCTNFNNKLTVVLDGKTEVGTGITNQNIQSSIFIGGVPWGSSTETIARQAGVTVESSFGGCIIFQSAAKEIDYVKAVTDMHNADLDGCRPASTVATSGQIGTCLPFNSSVVYSGKTEIFNDSTANVFTDYLYRVESYHDGTSGSAKSAWMSTRSGQGAPSGLQAPIQLVPLPGGETVIVTWSLPERPNGVITEYRILSYRVNPPGTPAIETVITDTSVLNATISGLQPYTTYDIRIQASTVGGSSVGPAKNVTTEESVPENVPGPTAVRRPKELVVHWTEPGRPNGVITQYNLTLDGQLVFSGTDNNFTIRNLQVYTEYLLQLTACTRIGCAQGPEVRLRTGELPPEGIYTPVVFVRGTTEVEVNWRSPNITNGVIVRYEILFATSDVLDAYVSKFNATPNVSSTVITNLTAGTSYYFRVRPFSGGGGTFSGAAQVTTHEDVPDGIPAPLVIALSPYALFVIMLAPGKPNGVILNYELYQDGVSEPVLNELQLTNYTADRLKPYSLHTFRVRACTAKGCAYGKKAEAYTKEIAPNGTLTLTARVRNATAVDANWTRVALPNGKLFYNLMVYGKFVICDSGDLRTEDRIETAISVEEAEKLFTYNGLLPFSDYRLWLNASNSVGFILSNNVTVSTPEGVPDGLKAPNVTVLNSTAVHVTWEQPALPNGIVLGYGLHQKTDGSETLRFSGMGFNFTVTGLDPFTDYQFRVNASTVAGSGFSEWTLVKTSEDVPSSPDAPDFRNVTSASVTLVWDEPAEPNGVLLYYVIYQNGTEIKRVTGNVTKYVAVGLQPFTVYVFKLSVCTAVGCSNSSDSVPMRTLESGPQGLSAPRLSSPSGRTVVIEWNPPSVPNGVILKYVMQRRVVGGGNPSDVAEVNASLPLRYEDNTAQPVTNYQYRVIAYNSGPGEPSPYGNITTGEGDPEGIAAPTVVALSPYAIHVTWKKPSIPNGVVTQYVIRVVDQQQSRNTTVNANEPFALNVTSLDPYIMYNVFVSACTVAACGSSPPSQVRTLPAKPEMQPAPTAKTDSQTSLNVTWEPPLRPNGVILSYLLYRRTVEDLVENNISAPTDYVQVYEGPALIREYRDTGLGIFSLQQYKVTVNTSQGSTTSNSSLPYRTGPAPPLAGVFVNGTALNHTSVLVTWYPPVIKQLRGSAVSYTLDVEERSVVSRVGTYPGTQTRVTVNNLKANTVYTFYVEINNGAGTFKSAGFGISTLDGMPEDFDPPALYVVSSTAIRVSWNETGNPNGVVILYKIYVNNTLWANTTGDQLQVIVSGLQPFTFYSIKVAVCTTHGCTLSVARQARTNAAAPTGFAAPRLTAGSTFIVVQWEPPSRPNGIMSGYQIFRRMVYSCPTSPPPNSKCTFIECLLSEQLCGVTCYNPANQVCCSGVLHPRDPSKTCCGANYLRKNQASDVCCGNTFHIQQADYQCCYGNYISVASGRVCCPKSQGGSVVGLGNACCGDTPYNKNDPTKVCVCGALYDPIPPRKCCGGKVVASAQVCCGDEKNGAAYDLEASKTCCGAQYISGDTSLCCQGSAGDVVVYNYTSARDKSTSNHKCCGKKRISSFLTCCNERGYNSTYQTCADISSNGTLGCGMGTICNKTDALAAMCDRCDFDNSTMNCGFVAGHYAPTPSTVVPRICATDYEEILKNQYDADIREYNDTGLSPHTEYEHYLVAINNGFNVSSPEAKNRTLMGRPEGLLPPVAVPISSTEIRVTWSKPAKPNGEIQEYRLTRVSGQIKLRQVVYTGLNLTYTDRGLEPFTGYGYVIEACTTHCSSAEMTSLIYTDQAAPAEVNAAILLPLNFSAINVSWIEPSKPNGQIIRYNVSRVVNSTYKIHLNPNDKGLSVRSLVIGGLKPYTNYTFEVIACTRVGCTPGPLASTLTLQAPPEGVHPPNLTVIGAREIEATWIGPDVLNGVIVSYSLYRGDLVVYNGTNACYKNQHGKDICIFQDRGNGLQPVTTYNYSVAASTGGGTTRSAVSTATTPESSPEAITKPRLTVKSAYSILAEWNAPGQPNGNITSYSAVVNGTEYVVALNMSKLITGLNPFTIYSVRVKACTAKGCGLGEREHARTGEAPPIGQGAPTLVAREWNVVQVSWSSPSFPNGIVVQYVVYRKTGNSAPLPVCFTLQQSCLNSGLLGYTDYSYRIRVVNSAGFAEGPWTDVRTPQGPPQGIRPPSLTVLNSTAVYLSWTVPSQPNGIVTHYEVRYHKGLQTPDNSNVTVAARLPSNVLNAMVSGLDPYTDYQFLIAAINSRREGVSAWATAKTKQAPPADLPLLRADKTKDGKSMRMLWDEPGSPNGVITHYKLYKDSVLIYLGSIREYTVSRLVPYTAYEFQLEACNVAGCTRGPTQIIFSAEVDPQGLSRPTTGFINATAVELNWRSPAIPNGIIIRYEIYMTVTPLQKRRRRAVTPPSGQLVYSTNDTNKTDFKHTETGLKPYTKYGFSVRAVNGGGFTESDPLIVTTSQAAPSSVDAPLVLLMTAYSLNVTWKKPLEPNGVVQFYFVFRNNSIKYKGNELSFVDQGLEPYTVYSYTVEVCTSCNVDCCTQSSPSSRRTTQAAPSGVYPPALEAESALAIKISWVTPDKPNGIITQYQVYEVGDSSPIYTGQDMTLTVSGKAPFSKYSFYISACTSEGCTQSAPAEVRTKEAPPRDLLAPVATVGGSSFVRVEWNAPLKPYGVILHYLLTRNGSQVYNGTDLKFNDLTVAPHTVYMYVVTAVNSAGRVSSPPGFSAATNPGAPDNVSIPTLYVLSATSIKVLWTAPGVPNGVIFKYEVLYNFMGAQGVAQVNDAGIAKEITLKDLLPYTLYEVRIRACTLKGCSIGEANYARTFEAPPEGQNPPDFPTSNISARRVLVTWNEPLKPNGFMLSYRLYRRGVSLYGNQATVYGPAESVVNVTNGSALAYSDTNVKPYFKYNYRVISANSAGETVSQWSLVQTLSAAPEQLKAPHVNKTYPYSLEVFIFPSGEPNGEIRNYILEVSGRNVSQDLSTTREVAGLEPFTDYVLRVYVCTDGGCAAGPTATWKTSVGVPSEFAAPRPVEITNNFVTLIWDEPGKPNGVIQRYEVLFHETCAVGCPTAMPESGLNTSLSRRYTVRSLSPYTMYNFRIRVHNSRHSSLSDEQRVRTLAAGPQTTELRPRVNVSVFRVAVDWSDCFILNGPLDSYELLENGLLVYEGQQNKMDLGTRNKGEYTYEVHATTLVQGSKMTVKSLPSVTVEVQSEVIAATSAPRTASDEWQKSVWFIAVMALVAIIILFALIFCCMRKSTGSRTVFVRNREPLPPRTKLRSRPPSMSSLYTSSDRKSGSMTEMHLMNPYHSSTTALFDSTERLNKTPEQFDFYNGSMHKVPPDMSQDWDHYVKSYSNRDSGLYDDEKLDFSDSEPSTPYQSFKREQYFTDTHL